MKYTASTLPQDSKKLQEIVLEQQKIIEQIRQQYDSLQHQVKCLLRHQYGQKSEQGIPGQGSLFEALSPSQNESSKRIQKKRKQPLPLAKNHVKASAGYLSICRASALKYDIAEDQKGL